MSDLERAPRPLGAPAAAAPDDPDAHSTLALLASLARAGPECEVWREELNGRWCVFLRHAGRTYIVLPLEYAPLPERAAQAQGAQP